MSNTAPPPPKDFKIYIDFDDEVDKFYVAETEFAGLVSEDADAGRLISRLCAVAVDLLEVCAGHGWDQFGLAPGQGVRLIPVFKAPIVIDWKP